MIRIELKVGGTELAKVLHYYGLLESDNEFKIVCPFHEDINPSMLININEGSFYCFGCNLSGDAVKFVRLVNKDLDDLSSMKEYFKILRSKKVQRIKIKRKAKIKADNRQAQIEAEDYYFGLKTINWKKTSCEEKDYMKQRGFLASTLNKCKAKLTYNKAYPIVFPMFDLDTFRGWVCRTTLKTIEQKRKYLYNKGFNRSNTLVGDYNSNVVMVVEGYLDWLKMRQFGVKKVVAILGWKITAQQIEKLKSKGVRYIICALDNDTCGDSGYKYLKTIFTVIRFNYPLSCKDAGDLTEEQFKEANLEAKKQFRRIKENESNRAHKKSN